MEIKNYKKSWIRKTQKERINLAYQYSAEKEIKSLNYLIKKIKTVMK